MQSNHVIAHITRHAEDLIARAKETSCVVCRYSLTESETLIGCRAPVHAAPNASVVDFLFELSERTVGAFNSRKAERTSSELQIVVQEAAEDTNEATGARGMARGVFGILTSDENGAPRVVVERAYGGALACAQVSKTVGSNWAPAFVSVLPLPVDGVCVMRGHRSDCDDAQRVHSVDVTRNVITREDVRGELSA